MPIAFRHLTVLGTRRFFFVLGLTFWLQLYRVWLASSVDCNTFHCIPTFFFLTGFPCVEPSLTGLVLSLPSFTGVFSGLEHVPLHSKGFLWLDFHVESTLTGLVLGLTGLNCVLQVLIGFTEFDWIFHWFSHVLPHSKGFTWGFNVLLGFTGVSIDLNHEMLYCIPMDRILQGFTGFQYVHSVLLGFSLVWLGSNEFYRISMSFTGFSSISHLALLDLPAFSRIFLGFYWNFHEFSMGFTGFQWNLLGFTGLDWVLQELIRFFWVLSVTRFS